CACRFVPAKPCHFRRRLPVEGSRLSTTMAHRPGDRSWMWPFIYRLAQSRFANRGQHSAFRILGAHMQILNDHGADSSSLYPPRVWNKILEAQDAPKTAPDDDLGADDEHPKEKSAKERKEELLKSIGPVWKYGDPLPASAPMLVPNFVPD